ncbi:hypothetical protein BGZ94_008819 [Podila epigama]|nr:hypothetical protein BGZ94_008819 [Podila epigama]
MAIGSRPFYLVLTVFLFSQVVSSLWPRHYLQQHPSLHPQPGLSWLNKRSFDDPTNIQCQDVWAHPDRCAFVKAYCEDYPAGLVNYLHFYFCDLANAPAVAVVILAIWMSFLFGFVGVAACDFFCPNLSTIAKKLHLSESMTGVTFLAFGNGSPDVFSTFSAMGAGSASLAIGELVVLDGKITFLESIILVMYYFFYVAFVVTGNWWHQRVKTERELEQHARNLYQDDEDDEDAEPADYDEERGLLSHEAGRKPHLGVPKISTFAVAGPYDAYEESEEELDDGYISPGHLSADRTLVSSVEDSDVNMQQHNRPLSQHSGGVENAISLRPSGASVIRRKPSLVAAVEFNDVVRSLSLSGCKSRLTSYDPSYYGPKSPSVHKRHSTPRPASSNAASSRALSVRSGHSQEGGPSVGNHEQQSTGLIVEGESIATSPLPMDHDSDALFEEAMMRHSLILPDHHDASNQHLGHIHHHQRHNGENTSKNGPWSWVRCKEVMKDLQPIYFPTLLDWDDKSPMVKFMALTSIPMVFLLTLTLPVVEIRDNDDEEDEAKMTATANIDAPDSTVTTLPPPLIVVGEPNERVDTEYDGWCRTATTIQMLLAPIFFAAVISSAAEYGYIPVLIAFVIGSIMSTTVYYTSTEEKPPRFYGALCFVGFLVAITWIFLVANEVVGVLQAFGMIFGVSDAILGLTIFAMGNSLGDLVANITIARMGFPRMAFSACFGGPLLNMLLGVGISGTYMTLKTGTHIPLEISPTLFVSLVGVLLTLVAALIFVPRNGYMMGRQWGWFLLTVYTICTVTNVVVEVTLTK